MRLERNVCILAVLLFSLESTAENMQAAENRWSLRANYLIHSTGTHVFPGSDNSKVNLPGLALGQNFGNSATAYSFFPYGLELQAARKLEQNLDLIFDLRGTPTKLQLPGLETQNGADLMLTSGARFSSSLNEETRFGVIPSARLRYWAVGGTGFPKGSGNLSATVAFFIEHHSWEILFEAGLAATGVSVPTQLGIQRDASTLRFRITKKLVCAEKNIFPMVEFFHTHRSFFGSTLITGENSIFIDQASLILGLGVEL